MTSTTASTRRGAVPAPVFALVLALVLALGAVLAHKAWLGWGHEYQDPTIGVASGPYVAWQASGRVAALALLAAGAVGAWLVVTAAAAVRRPARRAPAHATRRGPRR